MGTTADQYTVRQHNTNLILTTLRHQEPLSRAEIAANTGLNRSTVSSIVNELIEAQAIKETELQVERIGRPGMLLQLNPNFGFAIGIDVNVDYISAVVLDYGYKNLWQKTVPVNNPQEQESVLNQALHLTREAIQFGEGQNMKALGAGIAIPGLVDVHQGMLILGPNLKWKRVPIRARWEDQFALPVYVENDANAAAMGEYYTGAAKGVQHFVCINVGVGIGGGIMVDGALLRGARGFASEVGHMLVEPNGRLCGCGSRGCLETVTGKNAIINTMRKTLMDSSPTPPFDTETAIREITLDQIVQAAAHGHPVCAAQLERVGTTLGLVVGDLVNIFNPELIIIGGYSKEMVLQILPELRKSTQARSKLISQEDIVEIRPSQFGAFSSVIGAAALVYDQLSQTVF